MSNLGLPFCGLNGFWDFLKVISNLGLGPWMMRIFGVGRENDTVHIWKFAFFNPFQNWTINYICIFYSKQACIIVVSSLGVLDPTPFMRPAAPKMIWQVKKWWLTGFEKFPNDWYSKFSIMILCLMCDLFEFGLLHSMPTCIF